MEKNVIPMPLTQAEETSLTLSGSLPLKVKRRDGVLEDVNVRDLHISEFPTLMAALGNEVRQVEIFCDKPEGWAKTLSNAAIVQIYELGQKINEPFFASWAQRRIQEQERIVPGITKRVADIAKPNANAASKTG